MAGGQHLILTKYPVRLCKNRWNLQIFFWAEKHLRFLLPTGLNMKTFGQVSMMSQNTFSQIPWKSQVGRIQYSSKAWQISKSSKVQKVLTLKFGATVNSFSCC